MQQDEVRDLRLQMQRVESELASLGDDVELLTDEGVDTSNSTDVAQRQEELQDELEQLVADLLAVLDSSNEVRGRELPNTARRPVKRASLPTPSKREGPPPWANNKNNSGE